MNIFLKLVELIFRPTDLPSKIGLGMITTGAGIIGVSEIGIRLLIPEETLGRLSALSDGSITISQSTSLIVTILGAALIFIGLIIASYRAFQFMANDNVKDTAVFYIPGFSNIDSKPAIKGISKKEQLKAFNVPLKVIDSRVKENLIENWAFNKKLIGDRIDHKSATNGYLASLGSVPFVYLTGTLFRDSHIPLKILEQDRGSKTWNKLNGIPRDVSTIYSIDGQTDNAKTRITSNENNEIGLAVSFTVDIAKKDLPNELKNHTLHVKLDKPFQYDALPEESEQSGIAKELAHTISLLKKKADKIHLFICAQASIIARLGTLFQEGMHGIIIIHHWDPQLSEYIWSVEFNGTDIK